MTQSSYAKVEPLFYTTYNFKEDDVLNIRKSPNYHADKLGEVSLNQRIQVFQCKRVGEGKWCKIEAINFPEVKGWVNAKYIKPSRYQEGYVRIQNQNSNCDYALKCRERNHQTECLVVTSLGEDDKLISLKKSWFNRQLLTPASRFSAMPNDPEASGYCNSDHYIYEALSHQKLQALSLEHNSSDFKIVIKLLKVLNSGNRESLAQLIHPKNGLMLSALSYFNRETEQYFTPKSFLEIYKHSNKLFWGYTEAKGEVIKGDLYDYMEALPHNIPHIDKVVRLNNYKNYPKSQHQELKAYEVYWIENQKLKAYSYQGLVVVLEAYQGQWYVVGICRDYWVP
ncbi:hypothetical protein MNB_SV-14-536 [hydrothermal vent metagenome]|uniref:SH3b domain-containing protein n=1 Tax=hydrothermal vent metagenome TaxID=652676 RepID=A0A1W1CU68_9ZZZZ